MPQSKEYILNTLTEATALSDVLFYATQNGNITMENVHRVVASLNYVLSDLKREAADHFELPYPRIVTPGSEYGSECP